MSGFPFPAASAGSGAGARTLGAGGELHCFRKGPQSGNHGHVSSSRHVKRSMRFPRTALSCFASCQGLCDRSGWECSRHPTTANLITVKQFHFLVQPAPTPPFPAEAASIPGSPHMTPNLLFYPVFDEAEAFTGMSNGEVVHPAAQHRIDQLNQPVHELGLLSPEHLL